MASDYGLNFGFRRSDESVRVSEGRLKTPVTGTFRLGSLVTFDSANPGRLAAAAAGAVGDGATVGLLVQEEVWDRSIYETSHLDSFSLGLARNDRPAVITAGSGTKVWFKNTAGSTRADGRTTTAVTMVDLTGVNVLDYLTWDGAKFIKGTGVADSMLRVTSVDATNGYCEAVLTR